MRTRTPLLFAVFALLAASSAVLRSAQQPARPAGAQVEAAAPAPTTPADAKLADKPAAPEVAVKEESAAAAAAAAATKGKDAAGRDTLSVDFPDEDIRNILRNVADLFELNLAMPDALQGKTTIKLRDVTWRQIFQTVLTPVNYTYVEEGNIIKIVSNESLTQEPVSTEVFLINYARAADILPTITSLVDAAGGGKIVVDTRSNALVITERPTRMNRVRPIIEALDRATDQVMIESKFVEVTNSDVKNIGVNWNSLANYRLSAGSLKGNISRDRGQKGSSSNDTTQGTSNESANRNTAETANTTTGTQKSGATNDGKVSAVNGVNRAESSSGTTSELINSTENKNATGTNNTLTAGTTSAFDLLSSIANTDATSRAMSAVFSASDFNLVLSALQSQQKTKIVSNPTIVTLNNTEAVINVGTERPLPRYTFNAQTGTLELAGFDFKPIGIILKVTPQVNARGFIKLTVEPEVSQSNRDVDMKGIPIPVIDTRKAKTQVSLKDGFTMGIGGLLSSSATNGGNKIPVLGSIPVLGRLFRSDNKVMEQVNLIIFITAKTINAEGGSVEQVFDSNRVRGLELRREDLPGYRDGSTPWVTDPVQPEKKSIFRASAPEGNK